jgi:hypothetical protein
VDRAQPRARSVRGAEQDPGQHPGGGAGLRPEPERRPVRRRVAGERLDARRVRHGPRRRRRAVPRRDPGETGHRHLRRRRPPGGLGDRRAGGADRDRELRPGAAPRERGAERREHLRAGRAGAPRRGRRRLARRRERLPRVCTAGRGRHGNGPEHRPRLHPPRQHHPRRRRGSPGRSPHRHDRRRGERLDRARHGRRDDDARRGEPYAGAAGPPGDSGREGREGDRGRRVQGVEGHSLREAHPPRGRLDALRAER